MPRDFTPLVPQSHRVSLLVSAEEAKALREQFPTSDAIAEAGNSWRLTWECESAEDAVILRDQIEAAQLAFTLAGMASLLEY